MFSSRNRFQYQVATGRLTLPVAAILTLIVWTLSSVHDWLSISSLLAYGLTSYLLIETETKFVLIRTRTTLPAVLFLLLYAAMPFLHETSLTCILPVLFILMLLFLSEKMIWIAIFVYGLGCAPIYPMLVYQTAEIFPAQQSSFVLGLEMAASYVSVALMPNLFGFIGERISLSLLPLFVLIFLILNIISVTSVLKKRSK